MRQWGVAQLLTTVAAAAAAWLAVAAGCVCVGSTTRGFHWPPLAQLDSRVNAVLLASVVGAALAAAGVGYQAVLRNPLADPYLLGVSSGASLAAYLWQFAGPAAWIAAAAALGQQAFALIGAVAAVAVVLALSIRHGRLEPVRLILVGVIVNAVNGSVFLLVDRLHQDVAGRNGGATAFLVGGLQQSLTLAQLRAATIAVTIGCLALFALAGQLNAAALSEAEAASLGVHVQRLRWVTLAVASAMTAAAVAVSGPIGFVGLICPHLARLIVGPDPRPLLPVSIALGAILLAVADAAGRGLANPAYLGTLLPVGIVTGLLGGPFFLLLLHRSRR